MKVDKFHHQSIEIKSNPIYMNGTDNIWKDINHHMP